MKHALTSLLCAGLLVLGSDVALRAAQAPDGEVQVQFAEARRQFDALEYEQAVPTLDRVVALLQARPGDDTRRQLASALELRARSKFGIGDQDGARQDLVTLLKTDATYVLTGQVSPRVVALFEEVQKETITSITLNVTPATAAVLLDGVKVAASGTLSVSVGEHTLKASQTGYKEDSLTFTAAPETTSEATLALARSSAVLSIVTAPADVEVVVDGVSKGRTIAGPPPAEFAERAARSGIAANQLSGVLLLTDLGTGSHRIQFRRACFVQTERRQEISQLDDFVLDPVKLDPAVAALSAQSPQADVTVFVDGDLRGRAPYSTELCEGPHTIELRSPTGRLVRKVDARAGQKIDVSGALRPAFALVSSTQTSLNTDVRAAAERAFEPLQSVLVFAPAGDQLDAALKTEKLPPDWLGYDVNRRPVGVTAEVTAAMRRDLSAKLAKAFDAQGIAAVTAPTAANRSRLVLTLLAAGAAEPDVLEVNLDQQDTVASAVSQLDRSLSFRTATIGATAIDVEDVPGAVLAAVDASGPAGKAGLKTGDVVVSCRRQAGSRRGRVLGVNRCAGTDGAAGRRGEGCDGDAAKGRRDHCDAAAPAWHRRSDAARQSHAGGAAGAAGRRDRPRGEVGDSPEPGGGAHQARVVERRACRTAAGRDQRRPGRRHRHGAVPPRPLRRAAREPRGRGSSVQGRRGVGEPAD